MEQSASWEADNHSVGQEIQSITEPETSLLCSKEPTNTFIKNCYNSSTVWFLKQWCFGPKKLFSMINCIVDNKSTSVNNDS